MSLVFTTGSLTALLTVPALMVTPTPPLLFPYPLLKG